MQQQLIVSLRNDHNLDLVQQNQLTRKRFFIVLTYAWNEIKI